MKEKELEKSKWEKTAAVIGNGGWGQIKARHLKMFGFNVIITDRSESEEETLDKNIEVIRRARVVSFSLWPIDPVNPTIEIIDKGIERGVFRSGQIVFENSSVKNTLIDSLKRLDSIGVQVCSVHELVSPKKTIKGANVWVMGVGENSLQAVTFAEKLHQNMGLVTHNQSLDTHDEEMAADQGVTHIEKTAEDLAFLQVGINPNKLREKGTANFQLAEDSRRRVREQEAEMTVTLGRSALSFATGVELIDAKIEKLQLLKRLIIEDPQEAVRIIKEARIKLEWRSQNKTVSQEIKQSLWPFIPRGRI